MTTTAENIMIKETKADRRKRLLNTHYVICGQLGAITGSKFDGKKISTKLFELERLSHAGATAHCNGENIRIVWPLFGPRDYDFHSDENAWDNLCSVVQDCLRNILGSVPKGFLVNGDARGYTLKLEEKSIDLPLHTDWGRYQILSPDLTNE